MRLIYLLLLVASAPAMATTMLLRSEWLEGQTRFCVYSMSSQSERIVLQQPHYQPCKKIITYKAP